MVVHMADGLDRNEFLELLKRLETESFAEGCFISEVEPLGRPEEKKIRIKLPNAQHGVLLKAESIDAATIDWAIGQLRSSILRK